MMNINCSAIRPIFFYRCKRYAYRTGLAAVLSSDAINRLRPKQHRYGLCWLSETEVVMPFPMSYSVCRFEKGCCNVNGYRVLSRDTFVVGRALG